jgi:hypothetical protein
MMINWAIFTASYIEANLSVDEPGVVMPKLYVPSPVMY